VAQALSRVDVVLGSPDTLDFVDVGAGRGELLAGVVAELPRHLAGRVRAAGVELADRPPELPEVIQWRNEPPAAINGLVIANEWLDDIPVDVVQGTEDGDRVVLVDELGNESIGPPAADAADWLQRWWPLGPGERAEAGDPRDTAWADLVGRLTSGYAIAIDYGHELGQRPANGSLVGYSAGRQVRPVPDGTMNLTAHVAMDSVAYAGQQRGLHTVWVGSQREALAGLGMLGERPPLGQAKSDPVGYVRALAEAGERADLRNPDGLGSFTWLVQATEGLTALF
jgi:SAM-dependent MidA family methyltransferase